MKRDRQGVFGQMHRLLFVLALVLLLGMPTLLQAHGGGIPFVSNKPLGEFTASVWLNPSPLETGQIHVTVALAKDESVVLNQAILVQLIPAENISSLQAFATHENAANRFLYEADFEVTQAGDYELVIEVDGQPGNLTFDVTVQAAAWIRSPWMGLGALAIVAAIWFLNRGDGNK